MQRDQMLKLMNDFYEQKVNREGFHFNEVSDELLGKMEEAGMAAPKYSKTEKLLQQYPQYLEDDGCHGIVCKFGWRNYKLKCLKNFYLTLKNKIWAITLLL